MGPVSKIPFMFISSMWDVKEPTHYSKRVVPDVVAVLCECMGGYREVIYLPWDIQSRSYITCALLDVKKLDKKQTKKLMAIFFYFILFCCWVHF